MVESPIPGRPSDWTQLPLLFSRFQIRVAKLALAQAALEERGVRFLGRGSLKYLLALAIGGIRFSYLG